MKPMIVSDTCYSCISDTVKSFLSDGHLSASIFGVVLSTNLRFQQNIYLI